MKSKKFRPTSYIVKFWNEDGSIQVKEDIYPMHLYSFDDVIEILKGRERTCDIHEGRYWKERCKYITTGNTFIWNGTVWVLAM